MRKNQVKEMLKEGKATVGVWIGTASPDISEILAHMDFDWLVFDSEHSCLTFETIQNLMQPMNGTATIPIVRVAWNDPVLVKLALDIGAYGVVIPWINNKEEAIRAVRACKYPPEGIRGCGPRRAALYGLDRGGYLATANEEILVIAQIETAEAVTNLDEILSVKGIDVVFIGPSDLAASMGLLGKTTHPKNLEMIDRVLEIGKRHRVPVGIYSLGSEYNAKHLEQGFQFIAVGSDVGFLIRGARDILKGIGRNQ